MGSKGIFSNAAPSRDKNLLAVATRCSASAGHAARHDGLDLIGLLHNLLGHGALDAVTSDNDAVLLAWGPSFQQLSTDTVLKHTRTGEHYTATYIIETIEVLKGTDILEVPGTTLAGSVARGFCLGHALSEQALDVVVHSADVRLVDQHTLSRQVTGIVDRIPLKLGMLAPVLVKNEQQLLSSSQREHGHENATSTVENGGNGLHKGLFSFKTWNVRGNAVGRLCNEDINLDAFRDLGGNKMSILFTRVIASEEDVETGDLDEEHGRSEHMAGRVGSNSDGGNGMGSMIVDSFNLGESVQMVLLRINGL